MTQRFDELYISRGEHKEIVAYYQKLVVHMSLKMRAMRGPDKSGSAAGAKEREIKLRDDSDNVVRVDFRQRCS
jgi:hypothetical protein